MKWFKRLTAVLGLFLVLGAFAACGGDPAYTVTVDCDEPIILMGLQVQISNENGVVASEDIPENGKVTFDLDDGTYEARIVEKHGFEEMLLDYVYEIKTLTEKERSVTIRLRRATDDPETQEKISYSVTVQLPDGTPVPDIIVQLCGGPADTTAMGELCHSMKTDKNGVAKFELVAGDYAVHIQAAYCPAGYTFDDEQYKMNAEGGSLTVQFGKV